MLTSYIAAALNRAHYEKLSDDNEYYGEIPELAGVYATGPTLEVCREELREVLEEWLVLGLKLGHPIPSIGGLELEIANEANR